MKTTNAMFRILTIGILGIALTSCGNSGNENRDDKKAAEDVNDEKFETKESENNADFLANAVSANLAEMALVELALDKSANEEIKSMSRQMKTDHTIILSDLRALAEKRGVTVPTEMTKDDVDAVARMREEKPGDFDKKWLKDMEDRHDGSLKKYRKCAEKTEDLELQTLANKHLVMIETHHHMLGEMLKKY